MAPRSFSARGFLLAATLFVAFNLRPGISSVAPLLETIRAELGLTHAMASLLTSIPLFCMGVFPFLVPFIMARFGLERGLLGALALTALAILSRAIGTSEVLFGSALLVGAGVAVGQALVPGVVKRHFAQRSASVMSLYSMCMTLGAATAVAVTAPIYVMLGSWAWALALWAVPAIAALIAWAPFARRSQASAPTQKVAGLPWRSDLAWRITLFSAGTFGVFWATQTWFVAFYEELGWNATQAGALLATVTASQVFIQISFATFADRWPDRRPLMIVGLITSVVGFALVALAPTTAPVAWAVLLGLGIGSIFPLALNLPIDHAADAEGASRLTALSLGAGYLLAALIPVVLGWIRSLAGSFGPAFLALAGLSAAMILLAVTFRRPDREMTA